MGASESLHTVRRANMRGKFDDPHATARLLASGHGPRHIILCLSQPPGGSTLIKESITLGALVRQLYRVHCSASVHGNWLF